MNRNPQYVKPLNWLNNVRFLCFVFICFPFFLHQDVWIPSARDDHLSISLRGSILLFFTLCSCSLQRNVNWILLKLVHICKWGLLAKKPRSFDPTWYVCLMLVSRLIWEQLPTHFTWIRIDLIWTSSDFKVLHPTFVIIIIAWSNNILTPQSTPSVGTETAGSW